MDNESGVDGSFDWNSLFERNHSVSSVWKVANEIGIESCTQARGLTSSVSSASQDFFVEGSSDETLFESFLNLLDLSSFINGAYHRIGVFMRSKSSRRILPAICGIVDDLSIYPCKITCFTSQCSIDDIQFRTASDSTFFDNLLMGLRCSITHEAVGEYISVNLVSVENKSICITLKISRTTRFLRVWLSAIDFIYGLDLHSQMIITSTMCWKLLSIWFETTAEPVFALLSDNSNNLIAMAIRGIREFFVSQECSIDYFAIQPREVLSIQSLKQDAANKECSSECVNHLFLLLGQSNMSGRGQAIDLLEKDDPASTATGSTTSTSTSRYPFLDSERAATLSGEYVNNVIFYDPIDSWGPCETLDIHRNVDIKKKTGIGPAISFACRYLDIHRSKQDTILEPEMRVGLIPASIGGSFLYEWMASYIPVHDSDHDKLSLDSMEGVENKLIIHHSYSTDAEGWILPNDNARYQKGCVNLLACSMKSLFSAMISRCSREFSSTEFKGVLFYQGESDCSLNEAAAQTYGTRLDMFLRDLSTNLRLILRAVDRLLVSENHITSDDVSCSIVAITSTRPSLVSINQIRQQQIEYCDSVQSTQINHWHCFRVKSIVDSFGLPLRSDNIHLTAQSSIALGIAIANNLMQNDKSSSRDELSLNEQFSPFFEGSQSIYDDDYSLDSYISFLRTKAIESIQTKYLKNTQPFKSNLNCILDSGFRAANFVYGEISFLSFLNFFKSIERIPLIRGTFAPGWIFDDSVFVDLGSGAGCGILAAAMHSFRPSSMSRKDLFPLLNPRDILNMFAAPSMLTFRKIIGIDLMSSKVEECKEAMEMMGFQVRQEEPLFCRYEMTQFDHTIDVELYTQNILHVDWSNASVVVACSTCFDNQLMTPLCAKFCELQQGAIVILLDKLDLSDTSFSTAFSMITSFQCGTSWGTGNAYMYLKI